MKPSDLQAVFQSVKWGEGRDRSVTSICFDSRKLASDCIFVAVRGKKADGHAFLKEAAQKGALALVVEDASQVPADYKGTVFTSNNSRDSLNRLASLFFGKPSEKLFTVGVTGTNGKTSITHMVEAILNRNAMPTGVIGTINHHLGAREWKTELTTPDPISFQERLRQFVDLGARAVALEVSSVGLVQSRVDEVEFDVAIFTNLTRDHLDDHKDMEDYFQAKRKLFAELLVRSRKPSPLAVINCDDAYGRRLLAEARTKTWSYGGDTACDLFFEPLEQGFFGTRFRLRTPDGQGEVFVRMPGLHNVYNAMAAIGAGLAAGADLKTCADALADLTGVKGRLEAVPNQQGLHVFVDYAHTDDALKTILFYLRGIRDSAGLKNRIITVFGCGGDRDRGKRPLMMKAAAEGSELVVVTSDNPRTEDPQRIVDDALAGAEKSAIGKTIFPVVDRRQGIQRALELAQKGDVVVIAGKGHEDYQQIGTVKHPFSDVEVVRGILR